MALGQDVAADAGDPDHAGQSGMADLLQTRGNQNFEMARGAWCGDYNEASTFLDLVTTNSGYNDANI